MKQKLVPKVLEILEIEGYEFEYGQAPEGLTEDREYKEFKKYCDYYYGESNKVENDIYEGKGITISDSGCLV